MPAVERRKYGGAGEMSICTVSLLASISSKAALSHLA